MRFDISFFSNFDNMIIDVFIQLYKKYSTTINVFFEKKIYNFKS